MALISGLPSPYAVRDESMSGRSMTAVYILTNSSNSKTLEQQREHGSIPRQLWCVAELSKIMNLSHTIIRGSMRVRETLLVRHCRR